MRTLIWGLAWSLSVLLAPAAMAQDRGLAIEYTVKVADIPGQLFHVTTDISNINQPALELSLPVWSPGWYVIENYAKNILRFRVTESGGRQLRPALVRKQTWRIDTRGISRITVEFDYRAVVLAANQARIAPDYAFFTGINRLDVVYRNRLGQEINDRWKADAIVLSVGAVYSLF